MQKKRVKNVLFAVLLIAATCAALIYANTQTSATVAVSNPVVSGNGILTLSGQLVQNKIFAGGDGRFSLGLTLSAADTAVPADGPRQPVDMVIVLDRSGSMEGQKIQDARDAAARLLEDLTPNDRFALVTYSNGVSVETGLLFMNSENRELARRQIRGVTPGGGTNLGAGLETGISLLTSGRDPGRLSRVILISDGLANQGVTDLYSLGEMAAVAVKHAFSVSTVGVGNDFNEQLMTAVADRGAGNYYYLENPAAFARVFQKEFQTTAYAAATGVEIRIPMKDGVTLMDAAGYPVEMVGGTAVFYPGDLQSGQSRKLFLTFQTPARDDAVYRIDGISARYRHKGEPFSVNLPGSFEIASVADKKAVFSSYDRQSWEKQVLQDEYNQLREKVAGAIREGRREDAENEILKYQTQQAEINAVMAAPSVSQHLEKDVGELRSMVSDTFSGTKEETEAKQKRNAKAMQFDAYGERRAK